jgi:hypothetical protein
MKPLLKLIALYLGVILALILSFPEGGDIATSKVHFEYQQF